MKIIKFTDLNSAKAVENDWHAYLKPLFKSQGRKFKKDGEIFNRYLGKDQETTTIIDFRYSDDLNGHYLIYPENYDTWPHGWVQDMVAMIPDGQEITDKIYPPDEEI